LSELGGYAARMEVLLEDAAIPHQVAMLIDPLRARDVLREGRTCLEQVEGESRARESAAQWRA
jgi:hypothetical protein